MRDVVTDMRSMCKMTYTFTVMSVREEWGVGVGGFEWREMTRQDLRTDNRNE